MTQSMSSFMIFFGTNVLNVSGFLIGTAFAIGIIWDAATDPVMGHISDHTKSRNFGRRHGYILYGTILLAAANMLLWIVPVDLSQIAKFLWVTVSILLFHTFSTLVLTPYNALAVDLTKEYNEQTNVQSVKGVFGLLGIILPIGIMAFLQSNQQITGGMDGRNVQNTYVYLAAISSVLILICGSVVFLGTYKHIPRLNKEARLENAKKTKKRNVILDFFKLLKNNNYRSLIIATCSISMATAFLTGMGLHVFTYTLKLDALHMYGLIGGLFLVSILSQPVWLHICKKRDKKPAFLLGVMITVCGLFMLFVILILYADIKNQNLLIGFLVIPIVMLGFGMGCGYSVPTSMFADIIIVNSKKSEEDKSGTIMGFVTFTFKIATALALLLASILLDIIGFNTEGNPETYNPSLEIRQNLGYVLVTALLAFEIIAVVFILMYRLKKADVINAKKELEEEQKNNQESEKTEKANVQNS